MRRLGCCCAIGVSAFFGWAFAQPAPTAFEPISPEALAELDQAAQRYVESDAAVGSELLVMQGGEVLLHKAYGMADRESERAWDTQTISNIRSMTKPVTGVALHILIDRGKLALDDRVSEYLPGFDNDASRAITVRQLLSHRSGLPLTILETAIDEYPDLQAMANAAGEKGPQFGIDSKFWYSDTGTDVVGALVEAVSGQPLHTFVQAEILDPLGMTDSFYGIDASDDRFARIASPYLGGGGAWTRFWSNDQDPFYPYAWGSQSLYSTPLDYARFLTLFFDGGLAGERRILSEEAVELILTPRSEMGMLGSDERFPTEFDGLGVYYGQMMVLHCPEGTPEHGTRAFGHSGSDGTIAWAWPDRELIIQYYTQSRGGLSAMRIEGEVNRLIINPGAESQEVIPERYKDYVGRYIANFGSFDSEVFEVLVKDGKLALDIPSMLVFELLEPDDQGLWAFAIAPDQGKVSFEKRDGRVIMLKMHQGPAVFDVPREGTKFALAQAKPLHVSRSDLEPLVGEYYDAESDRIVEVFIDDKDRLSLKAPPNIVVQLRPTAERVMWQVRQNPVISISFQRDDSGEVVSMTRHIGDVELVMSRRE